MKVVATYPAERSIVTWTLSIIAAVMLVVMLVGQLYGFDDFAIELAVLLPSTSSALPDITAALIVLGELLALPYLLGMYLSRLMRALSGLSAAIIGFYWLFIAFTNAHEGNSALLASSVILPGGIVAASWAFALTCAIVAVIAADSRFRHATS